MTSPGFDRAGTPEPPPLPVVSSSDVSPHGSAGLVNQGRRETVGLVASTYGDLAAAAESAALAKRAADQAVLDK